VKTSPARYYARFYRSSCATLVLDVLISVGRSLLILPVAFLVRYSFDTIIPAGDFGRLMLCGFGILALTLAGGGLTLWTRFVTLKITKEAIRRFRRELLKKLYALSRSYSSKANIGEIHGRIVQDTERLDIMSNALIAQLFPSLVTALGLCAVLVYLNPLLFLVLAAIAPLLYLLSRWLGRSVKASVRVFRKSFEDFSKGILSALQMMDLTRSRGAEQFEIETRSRTIDDLRRTGRRMAWLNAAYQTVHDSMVGAAGVAILVVGGRAVLSGGMTVGELLSFFVAVGLLRSSLGTISSTIPQIIAGYESLKLLVDDLEVTDEGPYFGTRRAELTGEVLLESVTFGYQSDRAVLKNIDFRIAPRETAALLGPSGAGKSTLTYLILGFYKPQEGRIEVGGRPLSDLDLAWARGQIGLVPQKPLLFPGTIRENLVYGKNGIASSQVIEAAQAAGAHECILNLPAGYDTQVGEEGVLLSGGQRQKIAIARALIGRPKILILDEPTNNLESDEGRKLLLNFKALDPPPSILIISHDLEILKAADSVFVLDDGVIVDAGPPLEMVRKPSFRGLVGS